MKQFVFASLTVLFFLLAARDFTGSTLIGTIAGFEGIICGASAIYLAMATVINEQFGRTVLPIGEQKKKPLPPSSKPLPKHPATSLSRKGTLRGAFCVSAARTQCRSALRSGISGQQPGGRVAGSGILTVEAGELVIDRRVDGTQTQRIGEEALAAHREEFGGVRGGVGSISVTSSLVN